MIYVENDWYSNFTDSVKSNDERAMTSMLADAISSLIASNRAELLDLIRNKANVVISNEPSNEEIADVIVQNLNSNNKLRVGIAYLIAKEKGVLASSKKSSRKSNFNALALAEAQKLAMEKEQQKKSTSTKKKIDWNKTADTVTAIANSITSITDTINQSRNGQNQFKNQIQTGANNKAPEYSGGMVDTTGGSTPPKKSRKGLYIGLAVATVLIVVGVVGYKKGWFGNK